jgi:hypothetical protein
VTEAAQYRRRLLSRRSIQYLHHSLRSSQVGAIHTFYLYSEMSDVSLPTLSWGRRARAPTSQERYVTDCDGGWSIVQLAALLLYVW